MKKSGIIQATLVLTIVLILFSSCVVATEDKTVETILQTTDDSDISTYSYSSRTSSESVSTSYYGWWWWWFNRAPSASIDSISPNPATKGSEVTFTGSGTDSDGKIRTYLWAIDGYQISTEASFTSSEISEGTHYVSFWVQDDDYRWSKRVSKKLTVTENPNVKPVATIEKVRPNPAIEGTEITFVGNATDKDGKIQAYSWKVDGNQVSNQATFTKADITAGTYIIAFSAMDNDNLWSEEITTTLEVTEVQNIAPVTSIVSISPNPANEGAEVTFVGNATDTDGTIEAYKWTIDGNKVSTQKKFTDSSIEIGEHTVTFSAMDNDNEWSEEVNMNLTITENPNVKPVASIDLISPNPTIEGSQIAFLGNGTDKDGSIAAYLWTIDGNILSTKASFTNSNISAGIHNIAFKVQDDDNEWSEEVSAILTINGTSGQTPDENSATVILTFDDGWKTDYTEVYPMLQSRGMKSTHYIIGSHAGYGLYMTWDMIKELNDNGFDIQSHSYTHPDLTTLSELEIHQEMIKVSEVFAANSVPEPNHIAYPYGEYNYNVISNISAYYDSGRVVTWGDYSDSIESLPGSYELPAYATENRNTLAEIDKAIAGNYTLILLFHRVREEPGPYDVSISEFTEILDYIEENNVGTQTISEYYDETFGNSTEIPNEAPSASIDSISPNPATKGNEVTFTGSGTDEDGTITSYLWTLDDDALSTEASFTTSNIDTGTHDIAFKVRDDDGEWSEEVSTILTINGTSGEVPNESSATVILTFDDGRETDYTNVYPMLQSRGMKSTHYIIGNLVGQYSRTTWDMIKEMHDAGFDIQSHTYTHSDLTTLSEQEIQQEMNETREAFAAHNIPEPRHVAYPYGSYNWNVISNISAYYDSGRVVTWGEYSDSTGSLSTPYELPAYTTYSGYTIAEIDKAMAGNYTLILLFHQVLEEPGAENIYDTSVAEFNEILNYIEANNIRTQTISEYYNETLV